MSSLRVPVTAPAEPSVPSRGVVPDATALVGVPVADFPGRQIVPDRPLPFDLYQASGTNRIGPILGRRP